MAKKITKREIMDFIEGMDAIQLAALAALVESELAKKFKK